MYSENKNEHVDSPAKRLSRKVYDSVFRILFSDERNALELYRGLHREDQVSSVQSIHIFNSEPVLLKGVVSDLGFIASDRYMVLIEAQSTWTSNLALRCWIYAKNAIDRYLGINVDAASMHSRRRVMIPRPEVYVVYTGPETAVPLPNEVRLSDHFLGTPTEGVGCECTVRVLREANTDGILKEYIRFCGVAKRYLDEAKARVTEYGMDGHFGHGMSWEELKLEAAEKAIDECIERNILSDFLRVHRQEVMLAMGEYWDVEAIQESLLKGEHQEGLQEGLQKGVRETTEKDVKAYYSLGIGIETISKAQNLSVEEVKAILGL